MDIFGDASVNGICKTYNSRLLFTKTNGFIDYKLLEWCCAVKISISTFSIGISNLQTGVQILFSWVVSLPFFNGNGFDDLCNWSRVILAVMLIYLYRLIWKIKLECTNNNDNEISNDMTASAQHVI